MRANTCWVMPMSCQCPGRWPVRPRMGTELVVCGPRRAGYRRGGGCPAQARRTRTSLFDDAVLRRHDLLAAVVTIGGHVVAQVRFARGRVGGQLLGGEGVVRAAHAALGRGNTGLLHSHGLAPVDGGGRRARLPVLSCSCGLAVLLTSVCPSAPTTPRTGWRVARLLPAAPTRAPPGRFRAPRGPRERRG